MAPVVLTCKTPDNPLALDRLSDTVIVNGYALLFWILVMVYVCDVPYCVQVKYVIVVVPDLNNEKLCFVDTSVVHLNNTAPEVHHVRVRFPMFGI